MARKRILASAVSAARDAADLKPGQNPSGEGAEGAEPRRPKINPFAEREGALADLAQGRVRDVRLRLVDPKTCRMWSRHNRIYDLLSSENCDDLISSMRAQGKQEIPAVVRRLKDDPEGFEYEVVSGARRHFAVSYLREEENRKELFYLIEIKDLEDEEAFRFADLENRGRKDISDYERGREYKQALDDFYGGNLTRMAERMEVSKALLSSYISLARLPREVLDAYGDPREIAVRHGQQLNPLLKGTTRETVIERAKAIAASQEQARSIGGTHLMAGAEVFKLLKAAGRATPKPRTVSEGNGSGVPFLTARIESGTLKLDVDIDAKPSAQDLAAAVVRAYERLVK